MFVDLDKIALITGSAIRVGSYIAQRLAEDGWKIALHYNSSEAEAHKLAKKILPISDVMLFQADLTNDEDTHNLVNKVNSQLGPISLIINNASIYANDNIFNLSSKTLEQSFHIHLHAPLYLAQAMSRQGLSGNIINIIDAEVNHNLNKFLSYSLSKKSLLNLTHLMAVNLAPRIRVNAIAPGPILFKEGQDLKIFQDIINKSPLKIAPKLCEIYQTIQFFLNTPSTTGQMIFLDGGGHLV